MPESDSQVLARIEAQRRTLGAAGPQLVDDALGEKPDLIMRGAPFEPLSDQANAQRFALLHGNSAKYVHLWKCWVFFDGKRWCRDSKDQMLKMMTDSIMRYLAQAIDERAEESIKHARKSLDERCIRRALQAAERELAIAPDDFDANKMLLNVANGTLDLSTGIVREHRNEDHITRLVRYPYDPAAECPLFHRFLDRIMGGGPDASDGALNRADRKKAYLQRIFGYALTGDVSEKSVFCIYGNSGNNGKTSLLQVIRAVISEYSAQINVETLMQDRKTSSNNAQADLADLKGARFVTTSEAEEGQRLAIGQLKYLTQGIGPVKVCRKYENPFEFVPEFKLFLDSNHLPRVRGTERAAWNRLHPIEFDVEISKDEIDTKLGEKLLAAEAPGILRWMMVGCEAWRESGLQHPEEINQASEQWQQACDPLADFIEDCCGVDDPDAFCRSADVWSGYQKWAESERLKDSERLGRNKFKEQMERRGHRQVVKPYVDGTEQRSWLGVRLLKK